MARKPKAQAADFKVENHGSIVLVRALNPAADRWLNDNVIGEETQLWGDAVVVEPRYVADLVEGIQSEGMTVS